MELIDILKVTPALLVLSCCMLGLIVGSFLNVVALRLPRMLEISWAAEARQILELPAVEVPRFGLVFPPSACPSCGAPVRPWQNIPVISWLLLRGRCASCKSAISAQYPVVEAVAGVMSAVCAAHFGWGPQLLAALLFTWAMIALTVIDLRTMLLPDVITLPLLWLGLLLALSPVFVDLRSSVIGACAGYLSLWSIFHLFKLFTGKEGMGYGDFKLFGALGAWFGWQSLPMIILLSSVVGAAVGLCLMMIRNMQRETPIPFGPYLAGAGWIALVWGDQLKLLYFSSVGMR